jgi:hypothetical protein
MHIEIVNDSCYDEEENEEVIAYELILVRDFHKDCDEEIFRLDLDDMKKLKKEIERHI